MEIINTMENLFFELTTSLVNLVKPVISALSPLITGLILTYLLSPAVKWSEGKLKSRKLAILVTYICTFAAACVLICGFVILIAGALPQGGITETISLIESYFQSAMEMVNKYLPDDTADGIRSWLTRKFSLGSVVNVLSAVSGGLVTFFVGVVASIYLLNDKEFFIGLWEKFLALVLRQRVHGVLAEIMVDINTVLATFLKGAFVDSIIVAFLSSAALTLTGMEYAVIIGILAGLLNIIPYFGPFISMVPAFLTALVSGGPFQGLLAVLTLLAVQQLDSNYIYPKIVGATTGLHPLFVLLSVSILGYFFGITGMLLAVPAAGILQVLITRWACSK